MYIYVQIIRSQTQLYVVAFSHLSFWFLCWFLQAVQIVYDEVIVIFIKVINNYSRFLYELFFLQICRHCLIERCFIDIEKLSGFYDREELQDAGECNNFFFLFVLNLQFAYWTWISIEFVNRYFVHLLFVVEIPDSVVEELLEVDIVGFDIFQTLV